VGEVRREVGRLEGAVRREVRESGAMRELEGLVEREKGMAVDEWGGVKEVFDGKVG